MNISLFIGRFQPLHNGHMSVIKRLAKRSNLKIGIGSAQYRNTKDNPFSAEERKAMIKAALKAEHIKNVKIFFVPDIHNDEKWIVHVKKIVGRFDSAYSGNLWVISIFKKAKIPCKIIREIDPYAATKIRTEIAKNQPIDHLVPEAVLAYLRKIRALERIKQINRNV
jgi:nicotinamide-nucleotide adenylyltransferase